jgi:hypothetical protein
MIQGLKLPMHDLSRGCSATGILQVSLLAMKMAPMPENPKPHLPPSTAVKARETDKPKRLLSV